MVAKRVGTTLIVCTDNNCPVHDPRAAAHAAIHPAPVIAPAPEAETAEQAEERRQHYEAQRQAHQQEEERHAQERQQQEEREESEREAAFAKRDALRKKRETTLEKIVEKAPPVFTAEQLRVLLRALVNLDPYTFADDLAADLSEDPDNDKRSAEEVLLTAIDSTTDDKLTSFAASPSLGTAASRAKTSSTSSPKPKPPSSNPRRTTVASGRCRPS